MIWNRTHKPAAQIIPFPVERVRMGKAVDDGDNDTGRVLLFTGVRYERLDGETGTSWHNGSHRPPRRGGNRS